MTKNTTTSIYSIGVIPSWFGVIIQFITLSIVDVLAVLRSDSRTIGLRP